MDTSFWQNAGAAALMGAAIGLERQWWLHTAGLRTNALVAFGAALFVSVPRLLGGDSHAASHLAGQVVTGVGFLGGGLILREGFNVKGMNTAATLWCSAAVGVLSGAGHLLEGLAGTGGVLALNLGLRPLSNWLDRRLLRTGKEAMMYRLQATCKIGQEGAVRAVLMQFFHAHPTMTVQSLATKEGPGPGQSRVVADIHSEKRDDLAMEALMALVNDDPCVSAVQWEKNVPM